MRKNNIFLCVCLCVCLCGCSKESDFVSGAFGTGDSSKIELESNNQGVEITVESTVNEEDKFKIDTDDIDLTKTENQLEKAEKESEKYLMYTDSVDIRNFHGYQGILEFIKDFGGIDEVSNLFTQEQLTSLLTERYTYASKDDISKIINIIYSDDTQKESLSTDILHTEPGWVYTEEGWVNVYEDTVTGNLEALDENVIGDYTPVSDATSNIQVYGY